MPIYKIGSFVLLNGKKGNLESVFKNIAYVRTDDKQLHIGYVSELLPCDNDGNIEKYVFTKEKMEIFEDEDD